MHSSCLYDTLQCWAFISTDFYFYHSLRVNYEQLLQPSFFVDAPVKRDLALCKQERIMEILLSIKKYCQVKRSAMPICCSTHSSSDTFLDSSKTLPAYAYIKWYAYSNTPQQLLPFMLHSWFRRLHRLITRSFAQIALLVNAHATLQTPRYRSSVKQNQPNSPPSLQIRLNACIGICLESR